jgi:uncharacterized protein YndB with AHSA1/START domain
MTTQKTFKRRVRARMTKTGERYTADRRTLIPGGPRATPAATKFEPPVSDAAVKKATGRTWQQWFRVLDDGEAASRSHADVVRALISKHGVTNWWAQSITVGYERARGIREPGQHADGFSVAASKTVAVPVERLFEAFENVTLRTRWLKGAKVRLRTSIPLRSARFDWEDGSTRLAVGFMKKGEVKSTVALQHERLPDATTAAEMKTWWRERLAELEPLLQVKGAAPGKVR